MAQTRQVDLVAYLQRIGYPIEPDGVQPSYALLEALHVAHATHIPFENLDILLGLPIRLDLQSLQAKLVSAKRGGYCFEHNLLFAAVLEDFGFTVARLAARVRHRTEQTLPRTHMTLLVDVDGARWLADVGFGAEGLLHPVPFGSEKESHQFLWTYRVVEAGGSWMLQSLRGSAWLTMYVFTLEPQLLIDYEMANYFTSTHPSSRFVQTLTAQLTTPKRRTALRNRELIVDTGGSAELERRTLDSDDDLLAVLSEIFGLTFPPGTRFRYNERGTQARPI
jgi:N-hydroxyarylamine O-acetyltransferase